MEVGKIVRGMGYVGVAALRYTGDVAKVAALVAGSSYVGELTGYQIPVLSCLDLSMDGKSVSQGEVYNPGVLALGTCTLATLAYKSANWLEAKLHARTIVHHKQG